MKLLAVIRTPGNRLRIHTGVETAVAHDAFQEKLSNFRSRRSFRSSEGLSAPLGSGWLTVAVRRRLIPVAISGLPARPWPSDAAMAYYPGPSLSLLPILHGLGYETRPGGSNRLKPNLPHDQGGMVSVFSFWFSHISYVKLYFRAVT